MRHRRQGGQVATVETRTEAAAPESQGALVSGNKPVGFLLAALALGSAGQLLLDLRSSVIWGVVLLALGALLFGVSASPRRGPQEPAPLLMYQPVRWLPLAGALLIGVVSLMGFAGNRYTLHGVILWAGSLFCVLFAHLPSDFRLNLPRFPVKAQLSLPGLVVLFSILMGSFFRLHRIHTLPLEMGCDLPLIHANIAQILGGEFPIFFESHPGREGLFFYLAAPVAAVAGLSHTSIKVAAALTGILTIPVVYRLGREMFDPWTGALAAFLLSFSHWHIILSRVGYRAVLMPLLVSLSLLFLVRGLKTGRDIHYVLSALFTGLGLQSYNAFMVVPPMLGLALVLARLLSRRWRLAIQWRQVVLWAIVGLLAALPLLSYVLEDPQRYVYRAATRVTSMESALTDSPASTWLGNAGKAAAMFHYEGDSVYVSNVPRHRQLGYVTAILFAFGAVYSVLRRPAREFWLLWLSFAGTMLPSTLALAFPDEVPSAVRSIGALPFAMVISALGLRAAGAWLVRAWLRGSGNPARHNSGRKLTIVVASILGAGLAMEILSVYPLYFERYAMAQPLQNQSISLEMARTIDDFADDGEAYILSAAHWYDGNAVRAQFRRTPREWANELMILEPGKPPLDGEAGRVLVILHPDAEEALELLERSFGNQIVLEHRWRDGSLAFKAFYGER